MGQRIVAIRGAVHIPEDTPESIRNGIRILFETITRENPFCDITDCVDILFTVTDDLHSYNPATALRMLWDSVASPLFCMCEPFIEGMPQKMIRVMVHAYAPEGTAVNHIYLGEAKSLRPDITLRS